METTKVITWLLRRVFLPRLGWEARVGSLWGWELDAERRGGETKRPYLPHSPDSLKVQSTLIRGVCRVSELGIAIMSLDRYLVSMAV